MHVFIWLSTRCNIFRKCHKILTIDLFWNILQKLYVFKEAGEWSDSCQKAGGAGPDILTHTTRSLRKVSTYVIVPIVGIIHKPFFKGMERNDKKWTKINILWKFSFFITFAGFIRKWKSRRIMDFTGWQRSSMKGFNFEMILFCIYQTWDKSRVSSGIPEFYRIFIIKLLN